MNKRQREVRKAVNQFVGQECIAIFEHKKTKKRKYAFNIPEVGGVVLSYQLIRRVIRKAMKEQGI